MEKSLDWNDVADEACGWNTLAGNNLSEPSWEDVVSQTKVWFEEAKELYEAILTLDQQEPEQDTQEQLELVVDGVADTLFTFPVLVNMLSSYGFKVSEGFEQVVALNQFKLFYDKMEAVTQMSKLMKSGKVDLKVKEFKVGDVKVYTIRDKNNKIVKRVDHPLEDFSECLPQW